MHFSSKKIIVVPVFRFLGASGVGKSRDSG
jgi:hypothetical protein